MNPSFVSYNMNHGPHWVLRGHNLVFLNSHEILCGIPVFNFKGWVACKELKFYRECFLMNTKHSREGEGEVVKKYNKPYPL